MHAGAVRPGRYQSTENGENRHESVKRLQQGIQTRSISSQLRIPFYVSICSQTTHHYLVYIYVINK